MMIKAYRWVLYATVVLVANAAVADVSKLEALRDGSMKKLVFHSEAQEVSEEAFLAEDGAEMQLSDLAGQYILLNFWATWCAPCLKEMPSLNALQRDLGSANFRVVTVATGRNPEAAINRFFDENDISELPRYRDPKQRLSRAMAVLGLPISVIIDPDGNEIARLRGDAEWDSESARAIVQAMTEQVASN
ncbi:MAG: TlpA disulfide reductase family protein [Pseudomonadota bacterium]